MPEDHTDGRDVPHGFEARRGNTGEAAVPCSWATGLPPGLKCGRPSDDPIHSTPPGKVDEHGLPVVGEDVYLPSDPHLLTVRQAAYRMADALGIPADLIRPPEAGRPDETAAPTTQGTSGGVPGGISSGPSSGWVPSAAIAPYLEEARRYWWRPEDKREAGPTLAALVALVDLIRSGTALVLHDQGHEVDLRGAALAVLKEAVAFIAPPSRSRAPVVVTVNQTTADALAAGSVVVAIADGDGDGTVVYLRLTGVELPPDNSNRQS